jgi:AcrR family transcriptional regulator
MKGGFEMPKRTDTKENILKATAKIINEDGVFSLTLEAVAKVAGVSKGGLLYHFSSKEALLEGMVHYLICGFADDMEKTVASDNGEKGNWTRAYTTLTFKQKKDDIDMNTAFLAAVATKPELLKLMSKQLQAIHAHIENDNIDPIVATIIRLAVDGVYFNQLYGIELKDSTRQQVLQHLIALTKEEK